MRGILVATLVILGILPLTSFILALRKLLLAKLMSGISPLSLFILPLRGALVAKLLISGILPSVVYIHLF